MTDPTPAEALKALKALREIDRITRLPGFDLGTLAWHMGGIQEITEAALAALPSPATDAGEVRTYREGVEAAAKVCAEWSTKLSMRVDDLIRIRAPQRTVKAIREAANQVLNVEAAIRKLP